jgi:hypothetical protein
MSSELVAERQRLSQLTSDHQGQFSTSQETRAREFTDAQASRQDKFGTVIADYSQKLIEQNAEFTQEREAAVRGYDEDASALKTKYSDAAQKTLDDIARHRREVEKLVGVIGNLGVTSGYVKAANQARVTMWIWQSVTVASLGGLIIVAYKAFLPLVQGTFTWEGLVGRVFLSLTVGVLAAYAASQADKFLEMERRNRKFALELEAIGPYLAPLSPESQEKFRVDMGERSFGQDDHGLGKRLEKSPATVVDVLLKSKEFRAFITDLVRAARQG